MAGVTESLDVDRQRTDQLRELVRVEVAQQLRSVIVQLKLELEPTISAIERVIDSLEPRINGLTARQLQVEHLISADVDGEG